MDTTHPLTHFRADFPKNEGEGGTKNDEISEKKSRQGLSKRRPVRRVRILASLEKTGLDTRLRGYALSCMLYSVVMYGLCIQTPPTEPVYTPVLLHIL